jgi:hypothetical protein
MSVKIKTSGEIMMLLSMSDFNIQKLPHGVQGNSYTGIISNLNTIGSGLHDAAFKYLRSIGKTPPNNLPDCMNISIKNTTCPNNLFKFVL